jgi:hypothetical protein
VRGIYLRYHPRGWVSRWASSASSASCATAPTPLARET